MDMSLGHYILIGSYLFSAASWAWLWKELKSCRGILEKIEQDMARMEGLREGQEHEKRITRLEHFLAGGWYPDSPPYPKVGSGGPCRP